MLEDHRRKRTEWLTEFDLGINNVFHLSSPGIGYDAAVPKSTRTPLKPSLEQADDLSVQDIIYGSRYDLFIIVNPLAMKSLFLNSLEDFIFVVARSPIAVLLDEAARLVQ